MLKSSPENRPSPRRDFSFQRMVVPGLIALIILFLVIGSASQSDAPASGVGLAAQSFPVLALLAFVGRIVSFASPCTLPILPAYFAFATQSGRKRIAVNTIAFMLGVATMFSLLGGSASLLGRILLQNQQLLLLIGGGIVMVFGVMSLMGRGFTGVSHEARTAPSTTAGGSFAFGLTFSVGWSSCVGPILGVVLALAASTGSLVRGMMLLFIYALGLGLPLIIVSTFWSRQSQEPLLATASREGIRIRHSHIGGRLHLGAGNMAHPNGRWRISLPKPGLLRRPPLRSWPRDWTAGRRHFGRRSLGLH